MVDMRRWTWLAATVLVGCSAGEEAAATSFDAASETNEPDETSTTGVFTSGISAESSAGQTEGGTASESSESGETTGSVLPETSSSGRVSDSESTTTGGDETTSTSTSTSSSSGGEESSTGEEESSSSSSSTGMEPLCENELMCSMAIYHGALSGDVSMDPNSLTINDDEPTWITVQVDEDDDDLLGNNMRFTATLTSPSGYDFDLFVYHRPLSDGDGCAGTLDSSESVGLVDVVTLTWGEELVANGVDDARWIAIEIVPKAGLCDPGQQWELVLEGE